MSDVLWGIHGGRHGDAHNLFMSKSVVALGWPEMPDLSTIPATREAFKDAVASTYPDRKPAAVANNAGQLFRFVHEMGVGDSIVYPSRNTSRIYIGRVTGEYLHDGRGEPAYEHRRTVTWLDNFPRIRFSQGALYESGSAMSFFQIRNYADEFLSAVSGEQLPGGVPDDEDEAVALVAEEIEKSTRDYVLKRLGRELKGHPLAQFVGHLMDTLGYETKIAPPGPDRGVDIVASRDELGLEPPIIKVQVKSGDGSVGGPEVSQLLGALAAGEFGMVVTLGTFTNQARSIAAGHANLRLVDGEDLVNLTLNHYEELDSRYKAVLPLKRVFIPEALQGGD